MRMLAIMAVFISVASGLFGQSSMVKSQWAMVKQLPTIHHQPSTINHQLSTINYQHELHPLDDQAQMASEVAIVSDRRLEFTIDFRYISAIASMTEFANGLDANGDAVVTKLELENRFETLVNRLSMEIGFTLDGEPIVFKPDYGRFELNDLNETPQPAGAAGFSTADARIHYRFVFFYEPPRPLPPGDHPIGYWFSGTSSVLHTPEQQMVAIDARTNLRQRITAVEYQTTMGVYPKLVFTWNIAPTAPDPKSASKTPGHEPGEPPDRRGYLKEICIVIGAGLVLLIALFITRRIQIGRKASCDDVR